MEKCIYLNKKSALKFTKQEHVIPAGLGGIFKLPLGYVSDEINEFFSNIERESLRGNSTIALNRSNLGPGKRGKLNYNTRKTKTPTIRVFKVGYTTKDVYKLGFRFRGESYIIPQTSISFDMNSGSIDRNYYTTLQDHELDIEKLTTFKNDFTEFLSKKKRKFILIDSPYTQKKLTINIGFFNKKWYVMPTTKGANTNVVIAVLAYELLPILKSENIKPNSFTYTQKEIHQFQHKIDLNSPNDSFLYLKTAFNALAYLKGDNFVHQEALDEARVSIAKCNNIDKFITWNDNIPDFVKKIMEEKPDKAHCIILTSVNKSILAYVAFYGKCPATIVLTNDYEGEMFTNGMICDWKNRSDYPLDINGTF